MKKLKKRALIFDHDDTLVDSQRTIHYPLFLKSLDQLRPYHDKPSFQEFVTRSNQYGFENYIRQVYGFNDAEVEQEILWWRQGVGEAKAEIFDDLKPILNDFINSNGILIVYSYSESHMIIRDYERYFDFVPHEIIGFDQERHLQKPYRLPVLMALHKYQLDPKDCLLVDDMPLLIDTAKRLNMDMVGAHWAEAAQYVWTKKHHDIELCHDASDLAKYIFES